MLYTVPDTFALGLPSKMPFPPVDDAYSHPPPIRTVPLGVLVGTICQYSVSPAATDTLLPVYDAA